MTKVVRSGPGAYFKHSFFVNKDAHSRFTKFSIMN